jgi:hypothetical protein
MREHHVSYRQAELKRVRYYLNNTLMTAPEDAYLVNLQVCPGMVAPEWSFSRLHSDMKWDAGLGIRASAKGIVIRVDSAYSDEGVGVQMMISQPFQF